MFPASSSLSLALRRAGARCLSFGCAGAGMAESPRVAVQSAKAASYVGVSKSQL